MPARKKETPPAKKTRTKVTKKAVSKKKLTKSKSSQKASAPEKAKKSELFDSTETKRAAAASGLFCAGCLTLPLSAVSGADISGPFFEKAYQMSEFGDTEEELQEYQSKYATKINRFLDKYSQLEYFYELAKYI